MATAEEIVAKIGSHLLFMGVETINWNDGQWSSATQFCRAHGVDSVLVKICDGGNVWYGGMTGYRNIVNIFHSHGVGVVPYGYFYGNKYNYLDGEINLMIEYMGESGVFCADLEAEWNNEPLWATHLNERMKPVQGIFLVSTWADLTEQAWRQTAINMTDCVDAFMPQQYSNWLATRYCDFNGIGSIQPTVDLSNEAGPNDPVSIARAAYARGSRILSIWEYQFAVQSPALLDAVLQAFPKTSVSTPPPTAKPPVAPVVPPTVHSNPVPNQWQLADAAKEWGAIYAQRQQPAPPTGTGIYKAWLAQLMEGRRMGAVVTQEESSNDWNGKGIIVQHFLHARCEWQNNAARWFDARGEIK